ncbi:MAG: hypothetical protein QM770_14685 [Tepidisphaeraceae bacterium]
MNRTKRISLAGAMMLTASLLIGGCSTDKVAGGGWALPKGSELIADGPQPLGCVYPGTGRLQILDATSNSIVYTLVLAPQDEGHTLFLKLADGKVYLLENPERTDVKPMLEGLDPTHRYRFVLTPGDPNKPEPTTRE